MKGKLPDEPVHTKVPGDYRWKNLVLASKRKK